MPPDLKTRVWAELVSHEPRPHFATAKFLNHIPGALWNDEELWSDLLDRHGLRNKSLSDLDPATREHAINNFWAALSRSARALGYEV